MRIIECYIENFGVISNERFTFSQGFNSVCSKNGSGKTTLLSFIKAMLYGIGDTRRTALSENARKKYSPWSGGVYGGSMTLEAGGRIYRIERSFGAKASADLLRVFDGKSGLAIDISDPLGEALLGIDAEGFERTLYLSERKLKPEDGSDSISTKLSDLVGVDGDIGGFEEAIKRLDTERRLLRKKGGGGRIAELKAELLECEMAIDEAKRNEQRLGEGRLLADKLRLELKSISEREEELKAERTAAAKNEARQDQSSLNAAKRARLDALNSRVKELSEAFNGRLPSLTEIAEAQYKKERSETLACEEVSDDGEIGRVRGILARRKSVKPEDGERLRRLFTKRIPETGELDRCAEAILKSEVKIGKFITAMLLTTLVAVVSTLFGALLRIPEFYLVAPISLPIIITVYLFGIIYVRTKKKKAEGLLKELLCDIGCEVEYGSPAALLSELYTAKEAAELLFREEDERLVKGFILRRGVIPSDDPYALAEQLLDQLPRGGGASAEYKRLWSEYTEFINRYPNAEGIEGIKKAREEYDALFAEIKALSLDISKSSDGTVSEATRTVREIDAEALMLTEKRSALSHKLGALSSEAAMTVDAAARLGELTEKKLKIEDDLQKCEEKLTIIELCAGYLEKARTSINTKYLGATVKKFKEYSAALGADERGLGMTAEFSLLKEEGGVTRGIDAYSRGLGDLYALAARLALADTLFEGEFPPLLLDDPFTALDDEKCKRGIELLRIASRERQIIYVTCSASRK